MTPREGGIAAAGRTKLQLQLHYTYTTVGSKRHQGHRRTGGHTGGSREAQEGPEGTWGMQEAPGGPKGKHGGIGAGRKAIGTQHPLVQAVGSIVGCLSSVATAGLFSLVLVLPLINLNEILVLHATPILVLQQAMGVHSSSSRVLISVTLTNAA